jgi:hypothetical protein
MTHENNQSPDDLNWMEIAHEDAINDVRHTSKRLPYLAAAVSLAIIGAGAVFAQMNNEPPAQAEEISVTQTTQTPSVATTPAATTSTTPTPPVATPTMTPGATPVIPNVSPSAGKNNDDEREGDERHGRHGNEDDHEDEEDDD